MASSSARSGARISRIIFLEPRELVAPFELSAKTLATMDESMKNLKKGKASKPIDLSAFADK